MRDSFAYFLFSLLEALCQVGKESEGIAIRQLLEVGWIDTGIQCTEPITGDFKSLIRIVDREEYAINANLAHAKSGKRISSQESLTTIALVSVLT